MSTNTDEFKAKDFIINPELDAIIPKLNDEKFAVLKADIKSKGLKHPIEVMVDKTIVDGHNRYRACMELGMKNYTIDCIILPKICSIQEAKEYSIEINFFRRQMETYQAATWALGVYGGMINETEIAKKVGLAQRSVNDCKNVNIKLAKLLNLEKQSDLKTKLSTGVISTSDALGQLTTAENIDNIIAVVDNPNGDVATKIGKDNAKKFKAKLEAEYFEKKYDKKSLKAINTEIEKVVHPELYAPVEDSPYAIAAQKVSERVDPLAVKFPDLVKVFMVTTEAGFLECGDYIKAQAGCGKLYAIVTMLELPKELVNYD